MRSSAATPARALTAAVLVLGMSTATAAERLEFWTMSLKPKFTDYVEGVVKKYEAANPGTDVEWVDVPWEGYYEKFMAAYAAGEAPDVINMGAPETAEYAEQGAIQAIDKHVGKDRGVYFDAALQDLTTGGKLYGLPWYNATTVIAMNGDIFRKAGLDPAKAPATLDDYIAYARVIKQKTGMYGFMPRLNMIEYFMQEGLPVLQNGKAVFTSDKHVALVQKFTDAYKQDLLPKDTWRRAHEGATEMYTAGKLGMLGTGPQFLSRVRTDNPAVFKITTVGLHPMGDAKLIPGWLMNLSVPKGVKHPAAAVRLAKFVTNDDNQLAFSKLVVIFPSTKRAAADPYFSKLPAQPNAEDSARYMGAKALEYTRTPFLANVKNLRELNKNFEQNMEAAVHGQKPVKQALDDAAKFWNASLSAK